VTQKEFDKRQKNLFELFDLFDKYNITNINIRFIIIYDPFLQFSVYIKITFSLMIHGFFVNSTKSFSFQSFGPLYSIDN